MQTLWGKNMYQRCIHTQSAVCSHGELAGRWEGPRRVGAPGSSRRTAGRPQDCHTCQLGRRGSRMLEAERESRQRERETGRDTEAGSALASPVILWQWQFPPKFTILSFYRIPDFLGSPYLFTATHGMGLTVTAFPSCSRCLALVLGCSPPRPVMLKAVFFQLSTPHCLNG